MIHLHEHVCQFKMILNKSLRRHIHVIKHIAEKNQMQRILKSDFIYLQ